MSANMARLQKAWASVVFVSAILVIVSPSTVPPMFVESMLLMGLAVLVARGARAETAIIAAPMASDVDFAGRIADELDNTVRRLERADRSGRSS